MTGRYIIKVYHVPNVYELADGGRDDIDEQAEFQLQEAKHFQFLIQGKNFADVVARMNRISQSPRKGNPI